MRPYCTIPRQYEGQSETATKQTQPRLGAPRLRALGRAITQQFTEETFRPNRQRPIA